MTLSQFLKRFDLETIAKAPVVIIGRQAAYERCNRIFAIAQAQSMNIIDRFDRTAVRAMAESADSP
jgi:hypothetical protein